MACLPPELILLVLKVSDHETLMSWCDATIGHAFLHRAATQECWNEVKIAIEDLIPAPEEVDDNTEFAQKCGRNLSPNSKLNQAVKYASCIRNLDFNLSVDNMHLHCIPTYATSIHSAKLLLPAAINIETLSIDGPACKEVYNSVKEMAKLRRLFLGRRMATKRLRNSKEISYREHWPSERASWILPMLEEYENHQYWYSYAHNYLFTSKRLQRVYISVMKPYHGYEDLEEEFYDGLRFRGPLNGFLSNWNVEFKKSPAKKLLKSLSIVDHWFRGDNAMFTYPAESESSIVRDVCLEELYYQSSILAQPASFLSRYPDTKLRILRVSAAKGSLEFPDDEKEDSYDSIQTLVDHHKTSLQEIVLSDIWEADPTLCQRLEVCWKEHFSITDLTLSLHYGDSGRCPLSHFLWGHSFSLNTSRWGTQLQRICLGNSSLGITEVDCLDNPALSMLRILMICPHLNPILYPQNNFDPAQLALRVAAKAPASLQFLAVGNKVYWVNSGTLMEFEQAKITEKSAIEAWMTQDDLQFIDPSSKWNKFCHPPFSHSRPGSAVQDEYAQQNFLIARPVAI